MKLPVSDMTHQVLTLLNLKGIGPAKVREHIRNDDNLFENNLLESIPKSLKDESQLRTDEMIRMCSENSIYIISVYDKAYPPDLKNITDYPPVLFYKGEIDVLNKKCVAIVGKRDASEYGKEVASRISNRLSENNVCIISGLALGIDTAAHKGSMYNSGKTVAILAHGLDQVTPKSNTGLAEEILNNGGLLLSEHPPGNPRILKKNYLERNRIQSGVSLCSIIVESGVHGGSIKQAEHTHTQKRQIFTILPEKINSSNSDFDISGAYNLIDSYKAIPIHSKDDYHLIDEYIGIQNNI